MLRTVGAFEKHALSGIAFIDFDFFPFDDEIVSDHDRTVRQSRRGVGNGRDAERIVFYAEHFYGNVVEEVFEVVCRNEVYGTLMDDRVIECVFGFPHARNARGDLHDAVYKAHAVLNEVFDRFVAEVQNIDDGFAPELASFFSDDVGDIFVPLRSSAETDIGDAVALGIF